MIVSFFILSYCVRYNSRGKDRDFLHFFSSARPRVVAVNTVQPSPSDPTDIQYRLVQIELQLPRQSGSVGSSASVGSSIYIFSATSGMSSPWIVDSDALYQMTSDSTILYAITPLPPHFLPLHSRRLTSNHYTIRIYYHSLTQLALRFTRSTFMHEPHIYQQSM